MASFPLINGVAHSWSNVTIKVNGIEFEGVKSISYKNAVDRVKVYGTGKNMIGYTSSVNMIDPASIEIYMSDWLVLQTQLAAIAPVMGYMDALFVITVAYEVLLPVTTIIYDTLFSCKLREVANDHAQGPDALTMKLEFDVGDIYRNGLPALIDI